MHPYSIPLAAVCGAVYAWSAITIWAYYIVRSPIPRWIHTAFATPGENTVYYLSAYAHDLILNVLIALPFAAFLAWLTPKNSWKLVWIAVLVALVTSYWEMLINPSEVDGFTLRSAGFYFGALMGLGSLPLAFLLVRAVKKSL